MKSLGKLFGWRRRANIEKAFHAIAEVLFVHLQRQYAPDTDERNAMALAATVTFRLLGPAPDTTKAHPALPVDAHVVEMKLGQIKNEPEICRMVSAFRHRRNKVTGAVTPNLVRADAKLQELGILLPVDQIQVPASHADLMRQVREFELWVKRC
jgi:hypothetical protein